ncbi:hypothetical protein WOLCODRAFT_24744 [Wolfiporia cocos MD-104 SS10]|uniref:Uncharacterized protein n=1 Tax=Wolfiporia cocos (strain MD-104) TaxID=742152 RepID=A0A2H3JNG8_WOLCO|nr:hypothetical protein WOLCODRAFT_24744 [Wolfiporia cocos MD-104 SS10]
MPGALSTPQPIAMKPDPAPDAKPQSQKKQLLPATQASKSKKDVAVPLPADADAEAQPQMKKLPRRSSKPIFNWFQRKLAGTVRSRRASETENIRMQRKGTRTPSVQDKSRRLSVPTAPPISTRTRSKSESKSTRKGATLPSRKPTSYDSFSVTGSMTDPDSVSEDGRRSSLGPDSLWSPTSHYEADEDASLRPLPPSSPPSPSLSHSSSSYLSNPHTFRSMTASTKPTTVLSVDLNGGMAHIAQAPPTPTTTAHRLQTHARGPSAGGSITFTLPPPSPGTAPSRTPSGNSLRAGSRAQIQSYTLQAPQHTAHHPRNNPRPSSPPEDDASVLTLASSAFGMPGARIGVAALALSGRASLADDSNSHFSHLMGHGDSTSQFILGEMDDERLDMEGERDTDRDYHDVDASVRALRPRSSRRCSWESEASKWSASASVVLTGQSPGGLRDRNTMWTGSYRTGGLSVDHGDQSVDHDEETDGNGEETEGGDDTSLDGDGKSSQEEVRGSPINVLPPASEIDSSSSTDDAQTPPATPHNDDDVSVTVPDVDSDPSVSQSPSRSTMTTPKTSTKPLQEPDPMPTLLFLNGHITPRAEHDDAAYDQNSDIHSLATSDYHTDTFHTPSTTPVPQ